MLQICALQTSEPLHILFVFFLLKEEEEVWCIYNGMFHVKCISDSRGLPF